MKFRIKIIQFLIDLNERIIFYPRLRAFYRSAITNDSPVILDVGANKGQTIAFFLKLFPNANISAFEPNPKLFQLLESNFKEDAPNINIINKGISNKTGKLKLQETVTDETSTFEELNETSSYLHKKSKILGVSVDKIIIDRYEVDVITLFDFLKQSNYSKIDVLKIDTEGHELKCLQGLFLGAIPEITYIQIEHHFDDMYKNAGSISEIERLLADHGYKTHRKISHGFGDFDEIIFKK